MPFDPYHKWLGIPPAEQPPNHYRLFGLTLFEPDQEVIDVAASRQMAFIQQCATGPHVAESQMLLNELSTARLCLLNAAKKAEYDSQLRQEQAAKQPAPPPTAVVPPQGSAASEDQPASGRPPKVTKPIGRVEFGREIAEEESSVRRANSRKTESSRNTWTSESSSKSSSRSSSKNQPVVVEVVEAPTPPITPHAPVAVPKKRRKRRQQDDWLIWGSIAASLGVILIFTALVLARRLTSNTETAKAGEIAAKAKLVGKDGQSRSGTSVLVGANPADVAPIDIAFGPWQGLWSPGDFPNRLSIPRGRFDSPKQMELHLQGMAEPGYSGAIGVAQVRGQRNSAYEFRVRFALADPATGFLLFFKPLGQAFQIAFAGETCAIKAGLWIQPEDDANARHFIIPRSSQQDFLATVVPTPKGTRLVGVLNGQTVLDTFLPRHANLILQREFRRFIQSDLAIGVYNGSVQIFDIAIRTPAETTPPYSPVPPGLTRGGTSEPVARTQSQSNPATSLGPHGPGGIHFLDVDPQGGLVLSAGGDGTARVWDVQTKQVVRVFSSPEGHRGPLVSARFRPQDAQRVITQGQDGRILLWDFHSGELLRPLHEASTGSKTRPFAFAHSGSALLVGDQDQILRLGAETGHTYNSIPMPGLMEFIVSADDILAAGTQDRVILLFLRTEQRHELPELAAPSVHASPAMFRFAFSPDGKQFAYVTQDNSIRILEVPSWNQIREIPKHSAPIDGLQTAFGHVIAYTPRSNGAKWALWHNGNRLDAPAPMTQLPVTILAPVKTPGIAWGSLSSNSVGFIPF